MSFSVAAKGKGKGGDQKAAGNQKQAAGGAAKKGVKDNNAKIEALSTLKIKEGNKEVLSYSIADQKNHTGKNFTSEEDKQYTVFVKEISPDSVTLSVKGPGVFESKPISRSPAASPAGAPVASPATILGFEFSLTGAIPVKKATGLM